MCLCLRNNLLEGQAGVCSFCPCTLSAEQSVTDGHCWVKCPVLTVGVGCEGAVRVTSGLLGHLGVSKRVFCTHWHAVSALQVAIYSNCWHFLSCHSNGNRSQGDHNDVPVDWVQAIKLPSCNLSNVIIAQFQQSREIRKKKKWLNYQCTCC